MPESDTIKAAHEILEKKQPGFVITAIIRNPDMEANRGDPEFSLLAHGIHPETVANLLRVAADNMSTKIEDMNII